MSRSAISIRAKQLADAITEAKAAGNATAVAAIVERAVPSASHESNQQVINAQAFHAGITEAGRQYHIFDHLEDLYMDIKGILEDVKGEIADNRAKKKPIKPYHIDLMVKLVNQSRVLVTDAHKIKAQLTDAKHAEEFIKAAVTVLLRFKPDIKKDLYAELARIGVEGQIALYMEGSGSRHPGDADSGHET